MTRSLAVPRTLTFITIAFVLTIMGAVPAQAHGSNTSNTRLHTRLVSVLPALPGVSVQVGDNGEWVTLTNTGATPVVVYGYEKEPYLRIGPDGVWRNTLSPATYMNESLQIGDIPDTVDTKAPPRWVRLNDLNVVSWHDHRVHWMGAGLPPIAQNDPASPHLVNTWTIRAMQGSTPITVIGTLSYVPVQGFYWIVTIVTVVFVLAAVATLVVVMRLRSQRRRLEPAVWPRRERANADA